MDGRSLITVAATSNVASTCFCSSGPLATTSNRFLFFPLVNTNVNSRIRVRRSVSFTRRRKFAVFATREEPQFDEWELMELKFGRLLGEDPKLTLAKIITRRTNPDATFIEIEKEFYKNKGKLPEIKEVPFNVEKRSGSISTSSVGGLNLVRPVPKKGVKFLADDKPIVPQVRKPSGQSAKAVVGRSSVPNVILRKPTVFNEDDIEDERTKLKMEPNLTLKMRDEQVNDKISDMTLLRKPVPVNMDSIDEKDGFHKDVGTQSESDSYSLYVKKSEEKEKDGGFPFLNKPEPMSVNVEDIDEKDGAHKDVRTKSASDSHGLYVKKSEEKEKDGGLPFLNKPEPMSVNVEDVDEKDGSHKDTGIKSVSDSYGLYVKKSEEKEKDGDFPILNKPEPMSVNVEDVDKKDGSHKNVGTESVSDSYGLYVKKSEEKVKDGGLPFLNKPEVMNVHKKTEKQDVKEDKTTVYIEEKNMEQMSESPRSENATMSGQEDSVLGLQPPVPRNMKSFEKETSINEPNNSSLADSTPKFEASLIGKPKRIDQSMNLSSSSSVKEKFPSNLETYGSVEVKNIRPTSPSEDSDWDRAQDLANKEERGEVELVSASTKGFMVSFGSLIGFLPYRNLAAKWKFLAFETWLRRKGLDPSMYRKNLGVIGNLDVGNKNSLRDSSIDTVIDPKLEGKISPDMKLEDLLRIYDQEKLKFLQSFVGQKMKVIVITADKNSRKLILSMRPKERDELVEKKKSLMAKLSVGDVVKCCIQKITYFGIFVEIEGVPALIHQTEVSWDATLDPSSYFKVGQIVEPKVHQLDFSLGRIFLSMKEVTPDPLIESLESVVGGRDPWDGKLQIAEADSEWPDVESLIKELQKIEGIQSVSKGSFFLSPGLAPTFQVYMTSIFENQYKLLARSENKVQEVIVESSLSKDEMKSTILSCASRVE